MTESYYRDCRFCGRRIQMRKMPHGQWVAFEGYEQVHDCKSPVQRRTTDEWRMGHGEQSSPFDGLGFKDVDVGGYTAPIATPATRAPTPPPGRRTTRQTESTRGTGTPYTPRYSGAPREKRTNSAGMLIGLGVALFLLLCLISQCSVSR